MSDGDERHFHDQDDRYAKQMANKPVLSNKPNAIKERERSRKNRLTASPHSYGEDLICRECGAPHPSLARWPLKEPK